MALNTNQTAGLNALNQKISSGYTPTAQDTANLNYGKKQGYNYTPLPTGATKITSPIGLKGLNENQLYRSGSDIYKLPNSIPSDATINNNPPTISTPQTYNNSDINSLMAGTDATSKGLQEQIKLAGQKTPEEISKETLQTDYAKKAEEIATGKTAAVKTAQQTYGLDQNTKNLQDINVQIANLKAQYDNQAAAQEGRAGLAGSIYGRQALIQRQSATELAGLSAVAQAYQGNITLATDTAKKAVDAQYAPQEDYLKNLNTQLDNAYTDLNNAEKKKADQLKLVIDERTRLLTQEKEDKNNINNVAIEAAKNGADTDTVNKILSSKTPGDAIKNSGTYLKTASGATWDTFTDSNGNTKLINKVTGQVKDASSVTTNLGNQVGEIQGLPSFDTFTNNPGVNRSNRNNNPGNIKVTSWSKTLPGVIGVESKPSDDKGNFLIFDSPESGINAIGELLKVGIKYQNVTAEKAIKTYNGNGSYGAADLGLDPKGDFQSQIKDPIKLKEISNTIAVKEGFTGGTKTELSRTDQQAIDIFNGSGTLSKVSTKDYPAVSQKLGELKAEALSSGDITGLMRSSAGGKDVDATTVTSFEKAFNVIGQLSDLKSSINKEATGPIVGIIRSNNPYDAKAALIKAQLTALVPNLARGIYGEVGVLTDNDVALYAQTLPNLKSTEEIQQLILASTVRSVQRSIENKIKVQAGLGRDVSGLVNQYQEIKATADGLEQGVTSKVEIPTNEFDNFIATPPKQEPVMNNGSSVSSQIDKSFYQAALSSNPITAPVSGVIGLFNSLKGLFK